jgi:hypothetical protein
MILPSFLEKIAGYLVALAGFEIRGHGLGAGPKGVRTSRVEATSGRRNLVIRDSTGNALRETSSGQSRY